MKQAAPDVILGIEPGGISNYIGVLIVPSICTQR